VCSYTAYPELDTGSYVRKNAAQGGIGKTCISDTDCGSGYTCNNETDTFGKNVQQTGYCAQTYQCADGKKRYIGYPYNSGIPIPPPDNQNNGSLGYKTEKECKYNSMAQQNCVQQNGAWFAVYPGYCPVPASRRDGGPQGALKMSSAETVTRGFEIPAYATNMSSYGLGAGTNAKAPQMSLSDTSAAGGMVSPFKYEMSLNPRPANL
jgi:hypothetical protein